MKAYISSPYPGDTYVDSQVEVVVNFEHPYADLEDVYIKIDGEWAVFRGRTQPDFVTTRSGRYHDIIQWGVRKPGGLAPRDIMVQAWCSPDCATSNQRFYVKGAKKECLFLPNSNYCETYGGILESDGRPFSDGIEVFETGEIRIDGKVYWMPFTSDTMDIVRLDGAWFAALSKEGKTYLMWPDRIRVFDFPSQNITITPRWVNVQYSKSKSLHLPVRYIPSFTETQASDWFSMDHKGEWNMTFGHGIHVWWNKKNMIARHEPNPIIQESNDMLWTAKDIKEDFESVRVLDSTHVLVNDHLYLDTYYPEIIEVGENE